MNLKRLLLKVVLVIISMTLNLKVLILIIPCWIKIIFSDYFDLWCFVQIVYRCKNLCVLDSILLVLFSGVKHETIYDRIRYLIRLRSGITYVFSHSYAKIKIDSNHNLSLEKTLTLYNVIRFITSVFDKYQSHCCYDIFLVYINKSLC